LTEFSNDLTEKYSGENQIQIIGKKRLDAATKKVHLCIDEILRILT